MRCRFLVASIGVLTCVAAGAAWPAGAAVLSSAGVTAAQAPSGQTLYAFNTGLVLSIAPNAGRDAAVRIATEAGRSTQRWVFRPNNTVSPLSDLHLCLNVSRTRRSGYRLDMWPCDGAIGERFIRRAPSAHTPVRSLSPRRDSSLCVTSQISFGYFGTKVRSSYVQLSRCAGADDQAWSTTDISTTAGQFTPDWTDDLAISGAGQPGAVVTVGQMAGSLREQWTMSPVKDGVAVSPIEDLASCLTVRSPGAQLAVSSCNGGAAQSIVPIFLGRGFNAVGYVLAVDDGSYCLRQGPAAPRRAPPAIAGPCPNLATRPETGTWSTQPARSYNGGFPAASSQFEQFYSDPTFDSNMFGMNASGTASGSAVVLADDQGDTQIWTDIRPGTLQSANPDGSISIRPLHDLHVCLTVPNASYTAGVHLQVQTCAGAADQEFSAVLGRTGSGPAQFRPFAATSLCLAPVTGLVSGSPIGLEDCDAQQTLDQDDLWSGNGSWLQWAFPPQ